MRKKRMAEGIPIDGKTWADIRAAADSLGISARKIEEIAHGGALNCREELCAGTAARSAGTSTPKLRQPISM